MSQSLITIRMDENLKKNFEFICDELGMNMSTAITLFAKTVCREQRIPFEIALNNVSRKDVHLMNMEKHTKYEIWLYPERTGDDNTTLNNLRVNETFFDFDSAFEFLRTKSTEITEEMLNSDTEELQRCELWFAIRISGLDLHTHIIEFNDEGLIYTKDGVDIKIDYTDGNLYDMVYGFIKALHIG